MVTDGKGTPLAIEVLAGQTLDSTMKDAAARLELRNVEDAKQAIVLKRRETLGKSQNTKD